MEQFFFVYGTHRTRSYQWRNNSAADSTDTSSAVFCPPHSCLCLLFSHTMRTYNSTKIYINGHVRAPAQLLLEHDHPCVNTHRCTRTGRTSECSA